MNSNEEWMQRLSEGDETALEILCRNNAGLIRDRAYRMAEKYHCIRFLENGRISDYTKEILAELESIGMLAFLSCIRSGNYDSAKGALTTYAVPFIDGDMRRYLEVNLGTLTLNRESMTLVRRAQQLYDKTESSLAEVAEELNISEEEAVKHISYATHFFSVDDLMESENKNGYEYISKDESAASPAEIVFRCFRTEYLRELFHTLPKKEQDVLGKCFGVFGYQKEPIKNIAMYHMMKEDAVEKAKTRALLELRDKYAGSKMQWWSVVNRFLSAK